MRNRFQKMLAALLACTFMLPLAPAAAVLGAPAEGDGVKNAGAYLVARYDMSTDSGMLLDVSGNGNHMKLSDAVTDADFVQDGGESV